MNLKRSGPKVGRQAEMTPTHTSITHHVHGFNSVPVPSRCVSTKLHQVCPGPWNLEEGLTSCIVRVEPKERIETIAAHTNNAGRPCQPPEPSGTSHEYTHKAPSRKVMHSAAFWFRSTCSFRTGRIGIASMKTSVTMLGTALPIWIQL